MGSLEASGGSTSSASGTGSAKGASNTTSGAKQYFFLATDVQLNRRVRMKTEMHEITHAKLTKTQKEASDFPGYQHPKVPPSNVDEL